MYLDKLIECIEKLEHPLYGPSLLERPKEKHDCFELQNIETKTKRHGNPHYRFYQDIPQITQFQYQFF